MLRRVKKVFFHCASGQKHTGTVVTALLMNLGEATTVEEAEKLAMRRCPDISIKPEMRNVLNNMFDKMCLIQNELNSKI
ncbi:hypothetical protein KQ941_01910 [Paenibacillus xylanexedens]|nr:hypothetical protein [Paenibacillus xylanexedens]